MHSNYPRESPLSAFDQYQRQPYFPVLDGLRALSILLVSLEHARGREQWLLLRGLNGVTVFFVISGFLITTLCLREESRKGWLNLKAFYTRRVFRIFPVYYLALAVYIFLIVMKNIDPARRQKFVMALPYFATYFQEVPHYLFPNVPFEFAWSLGIEEKFYLVWPVLAFILLRSRPSWRVPAAVLLLIACALPAAFSPYGRFVISYSHILAGCIAALLLHHEPSFYRLRLLAKRSWVWLTCGFAVLMHLLTSLPFIELEVLFSISVTVALVALLRTSGTWIHSLLETRPMLQLGRISYSFYLFHLLCLNAVSRLLPSNHGIAGDLFNWALGVALAILVALSINRLFETPIIEIGRRWAGRRPAPLAATGSAAA